MIFPPENRVWYFEQFFHEISNPVFCENRKKYLKISSKKFLPRVLTVEIAPWEITEVIQRENFSWRQSCNLKVNTQVIHALRFTDISEDSKWILNKRKNSHATHYALDLFAVSSKAAHVLAYFKCIHVVGAALLKLTFKMGIYQTLDYYSVFISYNSV